MTALTLARRRPKAPTPALSPASSAASREADPPPTASVSDGHAFSAVPVLRPQAKLTVSQPSDPAEQEAEKTAAEVMRAEEPPAEDTEPKHAPEERAGAGTAARQVMRAPASAASPPADPGAPPTANPGTPTADPNAPAGDPLKAGGAGGGSTTITLTPTTRSLSAPSLSQLWDVMTGSGTRESASVQPKFAPQPQYEYDGNNNVTKATLTVVETKEMPQWQELPSQCPPIANEWNRFYGVLDAHEDRHLAIDRQHFTNLHAKLIGKPQAVAWQMVDDEIAAADKENAAYDATSNHGVNEGATLNSWVQCAPEKVKSTAAGGPGNSSPDPNAATPSDSTPPTALPPTAQAKLTVSAPSDPAEREADRMADRVLRMPAPQVQRACAGPGRCDCPDCRAEQERRVARESRGDAAGLGDVSPVVAEGLAGGGRPLDTASRAFLEPRFGHDFSRVRVHTDARAARSADAVQALAYTVGSDVVFGAGQYAPGTASGDHLLAHELTHTIQQGQGQSLVRRQDAPPMPGGPNQHDCHDPSELLKQIRDFVIELAQRALESQQDRWGLQWDNVSKANPKIVPMPDGSKVNVGSVEGHQIQYEGKQRGLKNRIDEWDDDDCNSSGLRVTEEERSWAFKPFPLPTPRARPDESPKPWDAPGQAPAKRYTITVNEKKMEMLDEDQAQVALQDAYDWLHNKVEMMAGEHALRSQMRSGNLFGWVSDLVGGVELPPLTIWDAPHQSLAASRTAMAQRAIEQAAQDLAGASSSYQAATDKYLEWKDGEESGGANVQRGAETLAIGCAVVFVVAGAIVAAPALGLGGAGAAGAGTAGASGAGAAGAGAAGAGAAGASGAAGGLVPATAL